jgi:hypothetical protein
MKGLKGNGTKLSHFSYPLLEAIERQYPIEETIMNSDDNNKQPMQSMSQDKHGMIRAELLSNPDLSNRAIARKLAVNDKTVAAIRKQMESTAEMSTVIHTIDPDGKLNACRHNSGVQPETRAKPELFAQSLGHSIDRANRVAEKPITGSVLTQVRLAFSRSPLAFFIGMIFGGFVPAATWLLMREPMTPLHIGMVAGGAIFSSIPVFSGPMLYSAV